MRKLASRIKSWRLSSSPPRKPFPTKSRDEHPDATPAVAFCLIGLVGGLFGGLLGIGGGSAIAPLLLLGGNMRPAQVAGTTLATVLVISIVGSGAYASLGHLNIELAWPIILGRVVGSMSGALMAKRLSMRLMVMLFLVILPYFAIKEFWPSLAAPDIATSAVSLGLLGLCAGVFSGLLGISGASLVVPSLVAFFLIDHHAAQGIAMGVAVPDSAAGAAAHARGRNINYRVFLYMAAPALVAALAGALLSSWLPVTALRNLFGAFTLTVWAMMLVRLLKDFSRNRPSYTGQNAAVRPSTATHRRRSISRRLRIAHR